MTVPRTREHLTTAHIAGGVETRMFALAYRVARLLGYSPRSSARLCRQVLVSLGDQPDTARTVPDTTRTERDRVLDALRRAVRPSIDQDRLNRAIHDAVLCDEVALLPSRQRLAVRLALLQRCTVEQIAERTGWNRQQIARLLRAGLGTVADRGQRWQRPGYAPTGPSKMP
jgi:DNA-directed RNA polymerase specialized sigma24 family protein